MGARAALRTAVGSGPQPKKPPFEMDEESRKALRTRRGPSPLSPSRPCGRGRRPEEKRAFEKRLPGGIPSIPLSGKGLALPQSARPFCRCVFSQSGRLCGAGEKRRPRLVQGSKRRDAANLHALCREDRAAGKCTARRTGAEGPDRQPASAFGRARSGFGRPFGGKRAGERPVPSGKTSGAQLFGAACAPLFSTRRHPRRQRWRQPRKTAISSEKTTFPPALFSQSSSCIPTLYQV